MKKLTLITIFSTWVIWCHAQTKQQVPPSIEWHREIWEPKAKQKLSHADSDATFLAKYDSANRTYDKAHDKVIELTTRYKLGEITSDPLINAISDELDAYYNWSMAKHDLDSVQMKEITELKKLLDKQIKELKHNK